MKRSILILGDDVKGTHGISNYTRPLAARLCQAGHSIHYLYSGSLLLAYDLRFVPRLEAFVRDGISYYKIVNSPLFATVPGTPEADLENPKIEEMFLAVLEAGSPDIVYVDSLLGLPSSLVRIAGEQGLPIVFTHHVYRPFCQKAVFFDREETFCGGPFDLHRCARCYELASAKRHVLSAQLQSHPLSRMLYKTLLPAYRTAGGIRKHVTKHLRDVPHEQADCYRQPHTLDDLERRLSHRLRQNISILNDSVDTHLCVSTDVQKNLVRLGIHPEKTRVQHIGSLAAERFRPKQHRLDPKQIHIGNIGGIGPYKGTHVLIEALRMLEDLDNWKATIHGYWAPMEGYLRRLTSIFDDPRITYMGKYRFEDVDTVVDRFDLIVLPSVCNDTAPQTIFESFAGRVPIVASNIGGFADFIHDGVNGILFEPGNPQQLASRLRTVLYKPKQIERMSEKISAPKTLAQNVCELECLFEEILVRRDPVDCMSNQRNPKDLPSSGSDKVRSKEGSSPTSGENIP